MAVSDTDDERSRFILPGVCGRLSNAAASVCASAGFGETAVCESASAAVVAKIAGMRDKGNFIAVAGKGDRCGRSLSVQTAGNGVRVGSLADPRITRRGGAYLTF
jgi:hypothetical protein